MSKSALAAFFEVCRQKQHGRKQHDRDHRHTQALQHSTQRRRGPGFVVTKQLRRDRTHSRRERNRRTLGHRHNLVRLGQLSAHLLPTVGRVPRGAVATLITVAVLPCCSATDAAAVDDDRFIAKAIGDILGGLQIVNSEEHLADVG